MIYAERTNNPGIARTRIQFRGFEISIACDDRSRGGNAPLTRTSLAVFKGEESVTDQFAGCHNVSNGAIEECGTEVFFEILKRIADENPTREEEIDYTIPWDKQPDPQVSYDLMPDRLRDQVE